MRATSKSRKRAVTHDQVLDAVVLAESLHRELLGSDPSLASQGLVQDQPLLVRREIRHLAEIGARAPSEVFCVLGREHGDRELL